MHEKTIARLQSSLQQIKVKASTLMKTRMAGLQEIHGKADLALIETRLRISEQDWVRFSVSGAAKIALRSFVWCLEE